MLLAAHFLEAFGSAKAGISGPFQNELLGVFHVDFCAPGLEEGLFIPMQAKKFQGVLQTFHSSFHVTFWSVSSMRKAKIPLCFWRINRSTALFAGFQCGGSRWGMGRSGFDHSGAMLTYMLVSSHLTYAMKFKAFFQTVWTQTKQAFSRYPLSMILILAGFALGEYMIWTDFMILLGKKF